MELVDIGVNLDHRSFEIDRAAVIERARQIGVIEMVLTGTTVKSSLHVAGLARQYPQTLYSTAGVHPHSASTCNAETLKTLRDLAARPEVVAIGECGLDFDRDFSPRPVQEHWFAAQVELACELKMPLFLHERAAHQRFSSILAGYLKELPPAVVHCFTGNEEELETYLEMGFYIGITGWICDDRRGTHLRELVRRIPLDRLMLETDAPFLTPRNIQPRPKDSRNEPAYLPYVLRTVAASMRKSPAEVATGTTRTAHQFFGFPSVSQKSTVNPR